MNKNIRKLTEGAAITALIGAFLFIDRQFVGTIELLFFWILPLPILIYSSKYGIKKALLVVSALFIVSLMVSTPDKIILTLGNCLLGLIYGGGVYHKINRKLTLALTTLGFVLFLYCTMFLFASFFGYDIIVERQMLSELLQQIGLFNNFSLSRVQSLVIVITIIIPLIIALLQTIVTHLLAVILLKKFKIDDYEIPNILELRLSRVKGIWLLIIYGLMVLYFIFERNFNLPVIIFQISIVIQLFCMAILMFYGVICILVLGSSKNKVTTILLAILAIIIPYIALVFGAVDSIVNLRGRLKNS